MTDVIGLWLRAQRILTLARAYRTAHPVTALRLGASLVEALAAAEQDGWLGVPAPTSDAIASLNVPRTEAIGPQDLTTFLAKIAARWPKIREAKLREWRMYQVLVYALLNEQADAQRLEFMASKYWPTWRRVAAARSAAVDSWRMPDAPYAERLDALRQLFPPAETPRRLLGQLAPTMVARVFEWPLLVTNLGGEALGLSVPLGLDVTYARSVDPTTSRRDPSGAITIVGDRSGHSEAWLASLKKSYRAAFHLWRAHRGGHGPNRQRIVAAASVSLDLSYAETALEGLFTAAGIETPVPLTSQSAEAALAVAICSRHLGQVLSSATSVSATIGAARYSRATARLPNDERPYRSPAVIDYDLGPVDDLEPKIQFAAETDAVRRVIANFRDARPISRRPPNIELPTATTLFAAMTAIRADLLPSRRSLRSSRVVAPTQEVSQAARAVAAVIQVNPAPVLEVSFPSQDVLDAIEYINNVVRPGRPVATAPRLSSVVIRSQGLRDSEFWMLLWSACDGASDALARLLAAPSRTHATDLVATLLNRFAGSAHRTGRRAPDVLVVIRDDTVSQFPSSDRPLDPVPLLAAASLEPNPDTRVRAIIGVTRIIIVTAPTTPPPANTGPTADVRADPDLPQMEAAPQINAPQSQSPLEAANRIDELRHDQAALSVFRSGIDRAELIAFLRRLRNESVRDVTARIRDLLRASMIAKVGRLYHVPLQRLVTGDMVDEPRRLDHHLTAALALIPALRLAQGEPADLDRGFDIERFVEASWHIRNGFVLWSQGIRRSGLTTKMRAIRVQLLEAQRLLLAVFMPASWEAAFSLAHGEARDVTIAAALVADLLDVGGFAEQPAQHLLLAAALAGRLEKPVGQELLNRLPRAELERAGLARLDSLIPSAVVRVVTPILPVVSRSAPLVGELEMRLYSSARMARSAGDDLADVRVSAGWLSHFAWRAPERAERVARFTALLTSRTETEAYIDWLGALSLLPDSASAVADLISRASSALSEGWRDRLVKLPDGLGYPWSSQLVADREQGVALMGAHERLSRVAPDTGAAQQALAADGATHGAAAPV